MVLRFRDVKFRRVLQDRRTRIHGIHLSCEFHVWKSKLLPQLGMIVKHGSNPASVSQMPKVKRLYQVGELG